MITHSPGVRLEDLDRLARRNHGVVAREDTGLSRSAWYRALSSGTIEQVHPGVARLHGTADTPVQRIAAAVLALRGTGLASHRSAALLWAIPRPETDPVEVSLHDRGALRRLDGVVVHRPEDQRRLKPIRRQRVPCTDLLRTLLDLGAVDADGTTDAVGHALAAKWLTLDTLETVAVEHARRGRPGTPALRRAIDAWSIDSMPADSLLEPAMRRLIQRYDLPAVEFHPVIEGHEVDFRVVGSPVVLECDGWTYHGLDNRRFERDRVRDADLSAAGWIVLRFTYRSVVTSPKRVADRIRATVDQWCGVPSPDAGARPVARRSRSDVNRSPEDLGRM